MQNNRIWILFTAVILIAGMGLFLLYGSRESERNLRLQKELELNSKNAELAQIQAKFVSLTQEKKDLEESLNSKINALNAMVKDYDENIKAQTQKTQSVASENQSLANQNEKLQRKLEDLSRKIKDLQDEKLRLQDQINRSTRRGRQGEDQEEDLSAGETGDEEMENARPAGYPAETVRLGNIVIQQSSGNAASVQNVNKLYGFLVVNAGSYDGLAKDSVINIVRNNKVIGKAVIEKAKPNMSAAVILPEWTRQEIRIGDLVSIA